MLFIHIFFITIVLFGSIAAYLKKSLNGTGAIVSFFLGAILYISGGITFLIALFAFFISSSALTRYKNSYKKKIEKILYDKTGTRDQVQVLANGGAALIVAVFNLLYPGEISTVAFFTAFAACNADTWSSEIGVLSRRKPVSILNFKPQARGISGGITPIGTMAGFAGALFIAAFYAGAMIVFNNKFDNLVRDSLCILILGFAGTLIDSLFGAILQPLYKNPANGALTEKRRHGQILNVKIKGFKFFSNDMVNFLSSGIAAGIVFLVLK
jgi:uncharacterized protein (TIGR00297 family)